MNSIPNENVWNFIEKANLPIDDIPPDISCSICQKLIVDARISECGCRFCNKCITNHLKEDSTCPGGSRDCKGVHLSPGLNLTLDFATIRKVLKLKVKCPMADCGFESELRFFEDHARFCREACPRCPYLSVGCERSCSDKSELEKHLDSGHRQHLDLLVEMINNLRNETRCLQEESMMKQTRIDQLEQEMRAANDRLDILSRELAEQNSGIVVLDSNQKRQMESMFGAIEGVNSRLMGLGDSVSGQLKRQADATADQLRRVEAVSIDMQSQFENMLKITGQISWEIRGFSQLQRAAGDRPSCCVASEAFYTHHQGYKLQLELWSAGWRKFRRRGLSVFVDKLADGRERLQPRSVRLDVEIGLWDPRNQVIRATQSRSITYSKYARNPCLPFDFASDDIAAMPIVNDCLVVKCVVKVL